jgi:hypothetical protein
MEEKIDLNVSKCSQTCQNEFSNEFSSLRNEILKSKNSEPLHSKKNRYIIKPVPRERTFEVSYRFTEPKIDPRTLAEPF